MVSKAAHLAISDVLDRLANHGLIVPNPIDVESYLAQHPDLAELLDEFCAIIRAAFGTPTELSLEVYDDPEIDDQYLTLYIRQTTYPHDMIDRIDAVCVGFHRKLEAVSGYFLVTTDFRRPKECNGI